jgi:hypothetical protein
MFFWEREVYVNIVTNYIEEEKQKNLENRINANGGFDGI